ncbi:hypothetical protein SynBMKMC1_00842 [Synechococcus sp. BMK-MC-1]|nr:hypothetical protein SynBMKMC1_00842 [Synechococcus sp. BMK-MC-1]
MGRGPFGGSETTGAGADHHEIKSLVHQPTLNSIILMRRPLRSKQWDVRRNTAFT